MEFLSKFFKSFGKDKDKDEEKKKLPLPKIAAWSGGTTVSCDGCRAIIPLDTWRYHCTECNNFDFCRDCYKAKKAEHGHYFAKETGDPHRNAERIGKAPALWECFELVFDIYAHRLCWGTIVTAGDGSLSIKWMKFKKIYSKVMDFSFALRDIVGLAPGTFVGICGVNCPSWPICELASTYNGYVTVPIHHSLDQDSVDFIVRDSGISVVVCNSKNVEQFKLAARRSRNPGTKLQLIIQFEPLEASAEVEETLADMPESPASPKKSKRVKLLSMAALLKQGHALPDRFAGAHSWFKWDDDAPFTLIYTSGSTGFPKGVIHTHASWRSSCGFGVAAPQFHVVDVSFAPLSHTTPRRSIHVNLRRGACLVFCRPDVSLIFEDLALIQPTMLSATPRLWNVFYAEYNQALTAAMTENDAKPDDQKETPQEVETRVLQRFRNMFGKRLQVIVTGGAPTSEAVLAFLKRCFGIWVENGYGTSETSGICGDSHVREDVEIKLEDVPELGYFNTDLPYPRGEVLVRSPSMFKGYWNNDQLTQESVTADGWYRTGDIAEMHPKTKRVKIIDRRKNFFKLAQGEFVAPEYIEKQLLECKAVKQIFVHGDPLKHYLVAVCVLNLAVAAKGAGCDISQDGAAPTTLSEEQRTRISEYLLKSFHEIATEKKMQPYEIPRAVHVELDEFSAENGLLTPTFKNARPKLKARFKSEIEALYSQSEAAATNKRVHSLLAAALGNESAGGFAERGGDSLSAIRLVEKIRQEFNVKVPVSILLQGGENVEEALSKYIAEHAPSEDDLVDGTSASASNAPIVWADETKLPSDIRLDVTDEQLAAGLKQLSWKRLFLTGATGYLGAFMLADLLALPEQPLVSCLIRCKSEDEGLSRLKAALSKYSILINEDLWKRVVVVPGDLEQPRFGLSDAQWDELAGSLDQILHVGAWVNGIFDYMTLKNANVGGTLTALRLSCRATALSRRIVPVHHVSTVTVLADRNGGPERHLTESAPPGSAGYGTSKWVAEKLVHAANTTGKIPITITRPATICGHTKTGVANWEDFTHRVLGAFLKTRSAPEELFDATIEKERRQRLNWIPVDVCSAGVIAMARNIPSQNGQVCNLSNPNGVFSWRLALEAINAQCSIHIEAVPYAQWKTHLREGPLKPLEPFFAGSRFPNMGGEYDASILAELGKTEAQCRCPAISADLVALYVNRRLSTDESAIDSNVQ